MQYTCTYAELSAYMYLVVSSRVRHHKDAGLTESCLDLIGECSWSETASNRMSTGVAGKLENSSLKTHTHTHTQ